MPSFRFLHSTPRIASIREPGLASFVRLESGQKLVVDHQKTTVPDSPWALILISVDLRRGSPTKLTKVIVETKTRQSCRTERPHRESITRKRLMGEIRDKGGAFDTQFGTDSPRRVSGGFASIEVNADWLIGQGNGQALIFNQR